MAELAQRHALASELQGVRVAQLMRGKATPDTGLDGNSARTAAPDHGRPRLPS